MTERKQVFIKAEVVLIPTYVPHASFSTTPKNRWLIAGFYTKPSPCFYFSRRDAIQETSL